MSRHERSLPPTYFEDLYANHADPWRFATSVYEREKYVATLDALPLERFGRALEVGCSIGVLTRQLAARCDDLLALDVSAAALAQAEARCADLSHVRFERRRVPGEWPDGQFDLILLSEVVYYLDRGDVRRLVQQVDASAAAGASILLVHWLGETHYPLSGDQAAETFLETTAAERTNHRREEAYRLDLLRTMGPRSGP